MARKLPDEDEIHEQLMKRDDSLQQVLARERQELRHQDCLGCRIMGAGAFIGLGAYIFYSKYTNLEAQRAEIMKSGSRFGMRSRAMGMNGLALSFIGLGLYRFYN